MSLRPLALLLLSVVSAAAGVGCAQSVPPAVTEAREAPVDSRAALSSARRDAARQYGGDAWIDRSEARQFGRFWVVELYARNGALVRYAISTRDGSIRERSVLQ